MVEDDDDRALFYDEDEFGTLIQIAPMSEGDFVPFEVTAHYDATPGEHRGTFRHGAKMAGSAPHFRCQSSKMPKGLAGRGVATIGGVPYVLFKIEHDGTGMAFVEVKRG
jgi:hypothetical protein